VPTQHQITVEDFGKPLALYEKEFRELKKLGVGGQGNVFLVERISDNSFFAAKKYQSSHQFHRAKDEFELLQKMRHDNIVSLEECFYTQGSNEVIIILELCPYGDLN